ncbi:hypothetical protein CDAR_585691 [Caerostris darwini]|uniref:Uncharacterized protein n=1 Tax=Caerostris darwini TaxID=1538125 RepID=A0AAV4TLM9_9ARAC|nr:hypothetical protein CDAR_585691 [Caerostris darwini]
MDNLFHYQTVRTNELDVVRTTNYKIENANFTLFYYGRNCEQLSDFVVPKIHTPRIPLKIPSTPPYRLGKKRKKSNNVKVGGIRNAIN